MKTTLGLTNLNFESFFSQNTIHLLTFIMNEGFILTLVGGAIRDYLMSGKLSDDLDFEIRTSTNIDSKQWQNKLSHLRDKLRKEFALDIESLEFGIFRFEYDHLHFEFASPRLEIFNEKGDHLGHKNFKAELISNLDYVEAFKRRDFTINAIGLELSVGGPMRLVDPWGGYQDLRDKILKACGNDFTKDPVRFLRLIRFLIKTEFELSACLKNQIRQFRLEKMTKSYFFKEAFKSDPLKFFPLFFNLVEKYKLNIDSFILKLSFLKQNLSHGGGPSLNRKWDEKTFFLFLMFSTATKIHELEDYVECASIGKKFFSTALLFKKLCVELRTIDFKTMLKDIDVFDWRINLDQNNLKKAYEFYHFYLKNKKIIEDIYQPFLTEDDAKLFNCWDRSFQEISKQKTLCQFDGVPVKHRKDVEAWSFFKTWKLKGKILPK